MTGFLISGIEMNDDSRITLAVECRHVGIAIDDDIKRHGKTANSHLFKMWLGEKAPALRRVTMRAVQ